MSCPYKMVDRRVPHVSVLHVGVLIWFFSAGFGLVHVVHGVDVVEAVFVGIDVSHPAKDYGVKAAARFGAGVFGEDGAFEAELGPVGGAELAERRQAKIGVQVPHGDA